MTIPAALSLTSATVGMLAALLALGMSSAPGWRELRAFAACSAFAALFTLANIVITLPVPQANLLFGSRLSLFFGGCHGVAWYFYSAAQERRHLLQWERAVVAGAVLLSALSLVPHVVLSDVILSRPWRGLTYRDAMPTPLGEFAFGYHAVGLAILFVRYLRRWRAGFVGAVAHAIPLGAAVAGAVHDGLAESGVVGGPYLLDAALFVLVVSVGASFTSRFVLSARALEAKSRELQGAQEELLKRERLAALGELAAVVAHEVRNPLAIVLNAIATLPKTVPGSEDSTALLAIVKEEAERLRDIVSSLLDFARPRAPAIAPAALDCVVAAAVDAARLAANVGPEAINVDVEPDLGAWFCDAQLVHQAVVNLTTNALQATGRKSAVGVTARSNGTGDDAIATISVADDGLGVPEELRERIFTPFFSTRPSGSGLGLAVVQRCAEAHGGDLSVTTTPGGGATFTLRLPQHPPARVAAMGHTLQ